MDALETFLKHYGVKGMKWGVRRDSSPTAVTTKATPGKKVSAQGGKRQEASTDAVNAAASRQKARASTTDSLSNQELQALVNRMNLEQQYARLTEGQISPGRKFVKAALGDYGKNKAMSYAEEAVTGNPELGLAPRPKLAPVVSSLKVAMNNGGGGKKKK